MSAATLFRPGGDFYYVFSEVIDELPRGLRNAARDVAVYLGRLELASRLDQRVTDAEIAKALGRSRSYVQKGLNALHVQLGKLGKAVIDRMPYHGRRIITFVRGLAPSGTKRPSPEAVSPQTPPESIQGTMTTTKEKSSSSSIAAEKTPEKAPTLDDPAFGELVNRACRLIPDATEGKVAAAVADVQSHGVDGIYWVNRALDAAEEHNRKTAKTGKKRVQGWGWVLNTLGNFQREGWPRPVQAPAAAADPAQLRGILEALRRAGWDLVASGNPGEVRLEKGPRALELKDCPSLNAQLHEHRAALRAFVLAGSEVPAGGSGA